MSESDAKVNGWNILDNFFKEDIKIKPFFEKVSNDCKSTNCQSLPVMMVLTIEELLDKIEDLETNNSYLENMNNNLMNDLRNLKEENRLISKKYFKIKNGQ